MSWRKRGQEKKAQECMGGRLVAILNWAVWMGLTEEAYEPGFRGEEAGS